MLAAGVVWVLVSIAFGFPDPWERAFQTLVAAVTLVMVFVIQHTQARHQAATQRKLDEILRVLPDADNALLALEHASDEELRATRHQHERSGRLPSRRTVTAPPCIVRVFRGQRPEPARTCGQFSERNIR